MRTLSSCRTRFPDFRRSAPTVARARSEAAVSHARDPQQDRQRRHAPPGPTFPDPRSRRACRSRSARPPRMNSVFTRAGKNRWWLELRAPIFSICERVGVRFEGEQWGLPMGQTR